MQADILDEELAAIGLKPAMQERSRQTRLKLLRACHALAAKDDFAVLSVEQICRKAGCSIGAFYNHFPTRDILLQALVIWECLDARAGIDRACREAPPSQLLGRLVTLTVSNYRERQAFLRCVIGAAIGNRSIWLPIRGLGQHLVDSYVAAKGCDLSPGVEQDIRFGFQAMFGLLNNELMNAPGPAKLDQPDLADRICDLIGLLEGKSRPASTESEA
jgi:AcrR family transcriptional regulator